MTGPKLICLGLGAALIAYQGPATFTSGGSRVTLSNFDKGRFDGLADGDKEKHALASGNPVKLQSPEKGFTAIGNALEFTWAELDPKTMEFRKGRLEGGATIIVDGDMSYKALAGDAKKLNKPVPAPPAETNYLQADSELFLYSGTVDRGEVTIPGPWKIRRTSKGVVDKGKDGKHVWVPYDQSFDADGSKGQMNLIVGTDGVLDQIETGTLEGPVHFKIVRRELPAGAEAAITTTYTGVSDHVDINLKTNPGTIVAQGHVIVDADTGAFLAHFEDEVFTFTVDGKLQPLGLQFSGKPGLTTAKAKDGGK